MPSELLVSRLGAQTWAALRQDGRLAELHVEPAWPTSAVGRIVKARVSSVAPGLRSAFLEVGEEREALLRVEDLWLPGAGVGAAPIEDHLMAGRELVVQITRDPVGAKGARVSCRPQLSGRLLVCQPRSRRVAVSRRIGERRERERLLAVLERLAGPAGFVARTNAAGAGEKDLRAEAGELLERWREIEDRSGRVQAPGVIEREPDLLDRLLRDLPRGALGRIVVDDAEDRRRAAALLGAIGPPPGAVVELHAGSEPLVRAYGLLSEAAETLRRRVELPSGGYLFIEETEALVAVDVNPGSLAGGDSPRQTELRTNLEGVTEVARQIRLRDLGGAIVIDALALDEPADRDRVREALVRALRADRARTRVAGWSELGLLQLTRQRSRRAPGDRLTRPCPCCRGRRRLKSPLLVAAEAQAEMRSRALQEAGRRFRVRVHPDVAEELRRTSGDPRSGFECAVEEDPSLAPQDFEVRPT